VKSFKVGNWYDSRKDLRDPLHNPAKGIAASKDFVYIVVTYHGSRRAPYEDRLDLAKGVLSYVGHGRTGDQKPDYWNRLLMDARHRPRLVRVFLDCGDLFRPKQLLYAGEWNVISWRRKVEKRRRVFRFLLKPSSRATLQQLRDIILYPVVNDSFEKALRRFGKQRHLLYSRFPGVLRARDNLAGTVGEYWGLTAFNKQCDGRPLIRCSTSFRDIDAIQSGTSNGFAIKTVTRFPAMSSNIWSAEFADDKTVVHAARKGNRSGPIAAINNFLIVLLDDCLVPQFIAHLPARVAKKFARKDRYQGSTKLAICEEMVRHAQMRVLYGSQSAILSASARR
jgi:hypothetical protein